MGLRPARCYAKPAKLRPHTRIAISVSNKNFVGASPGLRIRQFEMGNVQRKFEYTAYFIANEDKIVRDNSLEASRITFNRYLVEKLTRERYTSKLLIFPHHILRENKRAMGIGADRVSKGMKHAYGKAIGRAAIIHKGNRIFRIDFDKEGLKHINVALKKAQSKLGMKLKIVIKENKLTEEDRKRNIAITEIYREKLKKRGAELEAGLETAVAPTAVGAEAATAPTAELTSEATAHATSETKAKEQKAQEKEEKKK